MNPIKVSIIIVSYNTADVLHACIKSIYEQTLAVDYEIIVVDNSSADESVIRIKKEFPNVILIESDINLGFGKANNKGAEIAQGEYLFFLNSDTLLLNNAPYILSNFLDRHPSVGICGGNLYDMNLKPATSFSRLMPGLRSDINILFFSIFSKILYGKNQYFNYKKKPIKINGCICGADLLIRKNIFTQLCGFDPVFFMYYEETELIFRVKKEGYSIVSVPDAKILHLEGGSENNKKHTLIRSFESKIKYYKQTRQKNKFYLSYFLFNLTAIQRCIIFSLLMRKNEAIYWFHLLKYNNIVFYNFYKGFKSSS